MKTKDEIVKDWLPRYTGCPLDKFGEYILLTNFSHYLELFAEWHNVSIIDITANMPCATADGITMINFGMGSANAATIMDLLSAIDPKAALFLGKCGGLKKKNNLGDFILPARYILPTKEFGNMTADLKNICKKPAPWLLIWKQQLFLLSDLRMKYLPERCLWLQTNL